MTKKEAINESIAHWKQMRKWVRKQPKDEKVSRGKMEKAIGESWYGGDCPLCQYYFVCGNCPLSQKYGECVYDNENAWGDIYESKTWEEWLRYAEVMIQQLESL